MGAHEAYYLTQQKFEPAFEKQEEKKQEEPAKEMTQEEKQRMVDTRSIYSINGKTSRDPYNTQGTGNVVPMAERAVKSYSYQ